MPEGSSPPAVVGLRLNLGAGGTQVEGFLPRDGANGDCLFPLPDVDGSVAEIRASHVLEHFSHHQVHGVLVDWVRALQPGGWLKIAVPDFQRIARSYLKGGQIPIQLWLMGGQTDERDFHKCLFDAELLEELLQVVGLTDIGPWRSEIDDAAALPISLNRMGRKPLPGETVTVAAPADDPPRERLAVDWESVSLAGRVAPAINRQTIQAVTSTPRLGFQAHSDCQRAALWPLRIDIQRAEGAYWEQCFTRAINAALAEGKEWILTLDYDTIFSRREVEGLLRIAALAPEADAIIPLQMHRGKGLPLFSIRARDGRMSSHMPREALADDLLRISTGHFGCTLLRVSALRATPRPWFHSQPDADGEWGETRTDADVGFWSKFAAAGHKIWLGPRIVVGHIEMSVLWPDQNLELLVQPLSEYLDTGEPPEAWK